MEDTITMFEERLSEIEAYLALLDALEKQVQTGPPRVGEGGPLVTPEQQKILYSGVYLQLYNLIEATITKCVDAFSAAAADGTRWPSDLSRELRREWVRFVARTHTELSYDNRLNSALYLFEQLVEARPVSSFTVEKGGGGNWDDNEIATISNRLGLALRISPTVEKGVKRHFRNEKGALAFIKSLRNNLAHGSLSFAECGEGVTVAELRDLKDRTAYYLKEVVASFKAAIDGYEFLLPERRPAGGAA